MCENKQQKASERNVLKCFPSFFLSFFVWFEIVSRSLSIIMKRRTHRVEENIHMEFNVKKQEQKKRWKKNMLWRRTNHIYSILTPTFSHTNTRIFQWILWKSHVASLSVSLFQFYLNDSREHSENIKVRKYFDWSLKKFKFLKLKKIEIKRKEKILLKLQLKTSIKLSDIKW